MMQKLNKGHLYPSHFPSITVNVQFLVFVAFIVFGTSRGLTQPHRIQPSLRRTETSLKMSPSDSPSPSSNCSCWLAIITEPDACDTDERLEASYRAIAKAVSEQSDSFKLVSIRLKPTDSAEVLERAVNLTKRLVRLSKDQAAHCKLEHQSPPSFLVVCSSDWVAAAVSGGAHGIHVKEHHLSQVPSIRERLSSSQSSLCNSKVWIGTSAHSVESALHSYQQYQPDYYCVGTCFLTASHPEKTSEDDLEGPTLPGKVQRALAQAATEQQSSESNAPPKVLAIGGIDTGNCHIPVELGADGVAVIRSVLQAEDPRQAVTDMQSNMEAGLRRRMAPAKSQVVEESSIPQS